MLEGLDKVAWGSITHAYGPATDVPDQLRALAASDNAARHAAWGQLWGNLFHQGTRYPASPVAVPFFFELLGNRGQPDRDQIVDYLLHLAIGYPEEWIKTGCSRELMRARMEAWTRTTPAAAEMARSAVQSYEAVAESVADAVVPLLGDGDRGIRLVAAFFPAMFLDEREHWIEGVRLQFAHEGDVTIRASLLLARGYLEPVLFDEAKNWLSTTEPGLMQLAAAVAVARSSPTTPHPEVLRVLREFWEKKRALEAPDGDSWNLLLSYANDLLFEHDPDALDAAVDAKIALVKVKGAFGPLVWDDLMRFTFGSAGKERPREPVRSPSELARAQRRVLEATVALDVLWEPMREEATRCMLAAWGLPESRPDLSRFTASG